MKEIQELLQIAVQKHASDLHLTVGVPPMLRIDGELVPIPEEPKLLPPDIIALAKTVLDERHMNYFRENGEVDFAYSLPGVGRFRMNVYQQRGATAMAIRILNPVIPTPDMLGLPQSLIDITSKKRGLVLVTGITGSGKSTTLASLIDIINETYASHVITLEDPIEYLHRHKRSIVNQREIGTDTRSYAAALRVALRQDPDVILVGEMRDLETTEIALTAAETGHLVFSTLHTIGAVNTVDRIIGQFPENEQQQVRMQLADVLQCIVSQQLIPRKDSRGRIGAFEILLLNPAVRNLIREGKTYQIQTTMQTSRGAGMQLMDDALYELWRTQKIFREDALRFAQDYTTLERRLH